jgi:outer membrane protein TolC
MQWDAKLGFDLPTDRLPQRNLYREALISEQKQQRSLDALGDQIRSDLRDSLRQTVATLEGYRIQKNAVVLAARRIESTRLNLDAGRAATRDLLDAQSALLQAQNSATQALIDFQLAELALYRDLEVLRVENEGIQVDQEALQPLIGSKP